MNVSTSLKIESLNETPFSPVFWDMVRNFIDRSGEFEQTIENISKQMRDILERNGRLWLIRDRASWISGYMLAQIVHTEYGTIGVLIHQVYVDPKLAEDPWPLLHDAADAFGRDNKATEMFFMTRRKPYAFERRLKRGWELESFVMRRKII